MVDKLLIIKEEEELHLLQLMAWVDHSSRALEEGYDGDNDDYADGDDQELTTYGWHKKKKVVMMMVMMMVMVMTMRWPPRGVA